MKYIRIAALSVSLVATAAIASPTTTPTSTQNTVNLSSQTEKLSYTIGVDLGMNFKQQGTNINPQLISRGLADVFAGTKLLLTKEEMEQTLKSFQKEIMAKRQEQFTKIAEVNKKVGEEFLAKNKSEHGVVVLPSGLQYKVLTTGTGPSPAEKDRVQVEYTGKLVDGTVFDSTDKIGKPVEFSVSHVIPGWTEALKRMNPGATWEVYVPAKLAYGERGVGGPIGPNATLIYKIHLISIVKSKAEHSNS